MSGYCDRACAQLSAGRGQPWARARGSSPLQDFLLVLFCFIWEKGPSDRKSRTGYPHVYTCIIVNTAESCAHIML